MTATRGRNGAMWLIVAVAVATAHAGAQKNAAAGLRQERAFAARVKDAVRAALLQMYDMVFTPQLRCAIVASREPSPGEPSPKNAMLLARGVVTLAGGSIIAERSGGGMLITRLSSFGDTGTRSGPPRQVAFDAQHRPLQLAGRVPESGTDAYVVAAQPRDVVEAKIDGFAERTLTLQVNRMGNDYHVDVVRRAPCCEPPTIPYLLTLTLRR